MKSIQSKPLHPFLIAAYPVLALLGRNSEEIKFLTGIRALVIAFVLSVALFFILNLWIKNRLRSALITSLLLILFFSYGHIYLFLESNQIAGISLGRHRLLAPLWLATSGLVVWGLLRWKGDLQNATSFLNVVAVIALIFPVGQVVLYEARSQSAAAEESLLVESNHTLQLPMGQPAPDIYYIILDAYGRDDTLLQEYQLDNTEFLEKLEALGFYIAHCSQSNYAQTQLSLASSLNFNYLQQLSEEFQPDYNSRALIRELISHSAARQALENLGYISIAFETGFKGTEWKDADIYLAPGSGSLEEAQLVGGINDFEVMLLRTSGALLLIDGAAALPQYLQPNLDNPKWVHRERILYVLDQLEQMPGLRSPKFIFAHLVIPHPPYIFESDGEFVNYDKPADTGYPDQIRYLNHRLVPLLQDIIRNSETPPVIILQADHGSIHSPPNGRMSIFNAYYLPGDGKAALYENISPVNTFRVIFNQYFGGNYARLEDMGYFSVYNRPYDFTVIRNDRPGCP